MALTGLTVGISDDEFSRFEPENSVVGVSITTEGASLIGEEVTVALVKARRTRDVAIATKTVTLTEDDGGIESVSFDLTEILDEVGIPKARRGKYFVRVTGVTDDSVTADSSDFLISLLTTDRFKKDYLHGADQRATNLVGVHSQPEDITGVTITSVSSDTSPGWVDLAYTYNLGPALVAPLPSPLPAPVRTISWCGGPAVTITSSKSRYLLRKGSGNNYIEIKVPDVSALPAQSVVEEILIERSLLSVEYVQSAIEDAVSWLEDVAIGGLSLEPTRLITELDPNLVTTEEDSDINVFDTDYDKLVDAITFYTAQAGHWLNFKFTHQPLLKFNSLYGKIATERVYEVNLDWVEFHSKGGFVELVPFNQSAALAFMGMVWIGSLRGPIPLPNFWNFDAVVGFRDTPKVLLELVAAQAAIMVLTRIGQALRPAVASQSISRDGISESVSYLSSMQFGLYTPTINTYKTWVDDNLKKFRDSMLGPGLVAI